MTVLNMMGRLRGPREKHAGTPEGRHETVRVLQLLGGSGYPDIDLAQVSAVESTSEDWLRRGCCEVGACFRPAAVALTWWPASEGPTLEDEPARTFACLSHGPAAVSVTWGRTDRDPGSLLGVEVCAWALRYERGPLA